MGISENKHLIEMHEISKTFAGIKALDNVDFYVESGKINCLCGENGAGKSTLIKIMSGAYQKDSGEIKLNGKIVNLTTPRVARDLGITPIYQELDLVDCLSITENIFLGNEYQKNRISIDKKRMKAKAEKLMAEVGVKIDVDTPVGDLSVAVKQLVAIAKALSVQSKILILDEPSDVLTGKELDELFAIIRNIKSKGVGIVYISHRLEEVFEIGDDITVLRDGHFVMYKPVKEMNRQSLIKAMVGHDVDENIILRKGDPSKPKALVVKGLSRGKKLKNISFELRQGEILGVAGLVGAGRTELARAIIGADPVDSGTVELFGEKLSIKSPQDACKKGIGYIPEDRKKDGLVLIQSVGNNSILTILHKLTNGFVLNKSKMQKSIKDSVESLRIKCSSPDQQVKNLSGGNQQKVVVAKWFATGVKVLILDEPTRGVDVGAKSEIYEIMQSFADKGCAVMMISSEMSEILSMSDRIMVMAEGRISKTFDTNRVTQEELLEYALSKAD